MLKTLRALLDQIAAQPAAYMVTGLSAVGAMVIAFGHLTVTEAATLSGALTAIGTIVTAVYARPVNYTLISGAAAVLLQSLVLFNVHLSSGEIAAVVGSINAVLGLLAFAIVPEPLVSIRKKETALDELARKVAAAYLNGPGSR